MDDLALVLFLVFVCTSAGTNTVQVCQTQKCIAVADEISNFLDTSANPCEDFFQFACGGYLKSSNEGDNPLTDAGQQMKNRLERLITTKKQRHQDFQVDQKVRDFYKACQKFRATENGRKSVSYQSLARQINETFKKVDLEGWPFSEENFDQRDFAWYKIVPKMIEEALVYTDGRVQLPIINVDVGVNDLTKDEYVLKIDSPDFDEWDGKNFNNAWYDYELWEWPYYKRLHFTVAKGLMKILNPSRNNELQLNRSIEIDSELYSISNAVWRNRYNKVEYEYGQGNYTQSPIDKLPPLPCGIASGCKDAESWPTFIDSLLFASGAVRMKVKPDQKVLIKDPSYIDSLNETLQNLDIRPFEMANYMGFKILTDYIVGATNLKKAFRGTCINYLTHGYDNNEFTEDGLLNVAVGSMYVREYFSVKKKEEALKQVEYIRKTFEYLVPHVSWMDQETKTKAIEKLRAMGQFIAYPDELRNRSIMDHYYKDLQISTDDHIGNIKNLGRFLVTKTFSKLGESWSPNDWINSMAQVVKVFNAYYRPNLNQFVLPAGFMHHFNFDIDQPMYLNYPMNGMTIGHEIIHGFDNSGRNWDKKGIRLDPPGWWSNDTYIEYDKRAQCVVNTYESLEVVELPDGPKIDGTLTLGENIADIGGNRLAYYAYQLWVKDNGEEPLLPGLTDFNQRQLFWIRKAHFWCENQSDEDLRWQLTSDPHTPNKYRLIGSMMLSDEFAADFKCPKESRMNPVQNCSVGSLWPNNLISGMTTFLERTAPNKQLNKGIGLRTNLIPISFSIFGLFVIIY